MNQKKNMIQWVKIYLKQVQKNHNIKESTTSNPEQTNGLNYGLQDPN